MAREILRDRPHERAPEWRPVPLPTTPRRPSGDRRRQSAKSTTPPMAILHPSLRGGRHRLPPVVVATSEREAVSHDNGIEVVLVPSILSCATGTSLPTQRCPQADAAHLPIGDIAPIEKGAIAAYRDESGCPSGGDSCGGRKDGVSPPGRGALPSPTRAGCGREAGGGRCRT